MSVLRNSADIHCNELKKKEKIIVVSSNRALI